LAFGVFEREDAEKRLGGADLLEEDFILVVVLGDCEVWEFIGLGGNKVRYLGFDSGNIVYFGKIPRKIKRGNHKSQ